MSTVSALLDIGTRDSGLGREKGRLGILEYTAQKSLYWGLNERPLPWAD